MVPGFAGMDSIIYLVQTYKMISDFTGYDFCLSMNLWELVESIQFSNYYIKSSEVIEDHSLLSKP